MQKMMESKKKKRLNKITYIWCSAYKIRVKVDVDVERGESAMPTSLANGMKYARFLVSEFV